MYSAGQVLFAEAVVPIRIEYGRSVVRRLSVSEIANCTTTSHRAKIAYNHLD